MQVIVVVLLLLFGSTNIAYLEWTTQNEITTSLKDSFVHVVPTKAMPREMYVGYCVLQHKTILVLQHSSSLLIVSWRMISYHSTTNYEFPWHYEIDCLS